ncbi:MAG TPA: HAD-IIIA family hydrolase [Candidatus Limnocylindrales bacterium]|nr:HAD-IIIA family hydrolase [Candidatus Limnocylindrales bacterium]
MLYLFDMDGTLRVARLFPALGPLATWDQRMLPGRRERLEQLHAQGHRIGVASNQGAVAFGLVTLARCERIMQETNRRLGGRLEWIGICPHHPRGLRPAYRLDCACRKPAPGLLLEALAGFGVPAREAVFIGDRETDRLAAVAAGVAFEPAARFFAADWG